MLRVLWRLSKGHRLRPWRSPYLLWRIETFSGMHADKIGAREFFRFTWEERRSLARFLKWAAQMPPQPAQNRLEDRIY